MNQTPLDWEGNRNHILEAIEAAQNENVDILCLPELCITGYGCEDMFLSAHVWRTAWEMLLKIVPLMTASGWFSNVVLQRAIESPSATVGPAVGTLPTIQDAFLAHCAKQLDTSPSDSSVLFIGHGTRRYPRSRATTERLVTLARR